MDRQINPIARSGVLNYLVTQYTYSSNGNGTIATKTDPSGLITTYHYDGSCNDIEPTSFTYNATTLQTSQTWDVDGGSNKPCNGGVVLSQTGLDGNPSSQTFNDPLWRKNSTTDQNSQTVQTAYTLTSVSTSTAFNNATLEHVTTLDGIGRPILSQTYQGSSGSGYDTVRTTYDALGRVQNVTSPFTCSTVGSASCTSSIESITTYDALGRVHTYTDANGGTTTHTYTGGTTGTFDLTVLSPAPAGEHVKQRQFGRDGLGRLTSVCEILSSGGGSCGQGATGATGYLTSYVLDGLGRISQVTQGQQTRTFTFDETGRMVLETNPENGTTSYVYDIDVTGVCPAVQYGQLIKKTDAMGNITCFGYDGLNRMVSKTYNDTVTDDVGLSYDSGTNGGGRLTEAWTCTAGTVPCPSTSAKTAETFAYDTRGNLLTYSQSVPGPYSATINETFDALDRILTMSEPNAGFYGVKGWDGEGRATVVTDVGGGTSLQASAAYSPFGPTCVTYGNKDVVITSYDSVGHVGSKTISVGGGSCPNTVGSTYQTSTITWNKNGTVQSDQIVGNISGTSTNVTISYTYDDLGRIYTASSSDGGVSQKFSYDQFGNIQSVTSPLTGGTPVPNTFNGGVNKANNQLISSGCPNTGPCYDTDGRLILDEDSYSLSWDANGKVVGTYRTQVFIRDAFGRDVRDSQSAQNVPVPGFPSPLRGGLGNYGFFTIPLPGGSNVFWQGETEQNNGWTNFVHTDYLGNSTVGTNNVVSTGTPWAWQSFSPFGQIFDAGCNCNGYAQGGLDGFDGTDNQFSYAYWDTPAREQDPVSGRWVSPDPSGRQAVNPSNPQTWNRYSYAGNNPVSRFDPTGLDDLIDDPIAGGAGGAIVDPATVVGILDFLDNELFGPSLDAGYTISDTVDYSLDTGQALGSSLTAVQGDYILNAGTGQMIGQMPSASPSDGIIFGAAGGILGGLDALVGTGVESAIPDSVLQSFSSSEPTTFLTDFTVYRAEGVDEFQFGSYYGTVAPFSSAEADQMYNISAFSPNPMNTLSTYQGPAGTTALVGPVAGGTGTQVYIPGGAGLTLTGSTPLPPEWP